MAQYGDVIKLLVCVIALDKLYSVRTCTVTLKAKAAKPAARCQSHNYYAYTGLSN